jgi:hypothetical protein
MRAKECIWTGDVEALELAVVLQPGQAAGDERRHGGGFIGPCRRAGYGIRFPGGKLQMLTDEPVLTNEQTDGLLGGGARVVWVDATGSIDPLDVLEQEYHDGPSEESGS